MAQLEPTGLLDGDTKIDSKKRRVEDVPESEQEKHYFNCYAKLHIHEEMIADKVRTGKYRYAIFKNYELIRGKVVADIGAGTGILSMFCVQAGAKRVYAIEASDIVVHTKRVIEANKMDNKIVLINKRVEDTTLPEKVDVIVSEWMGSFLLYEGMLSSVLYARDNWLKEGGAMLPNSADIFIAPFDETDNQKDAKNFWDTVQDDYDLDMSCLSPLSFAEFASHVHVYVIDPQVIVAHAARIAHFDLMTIKREELNHIKGPFSLDCFGHCKVHGFAMWFDVHFPQKITLTTSPYKDPTHWMQSLVLVDKPFRVKQGTNISGTFSLGEGADCKRMWRVQLGFKVNGGEMQEKTYTMHNN